MGCARYYVVLHMDEWTISYDGRHYGPYPDRDVAFRYAVDAAHKTGENGHEAQVLFQVDGHHFEPQWIFGQDRYPLGVQ